jgi:hypothetical protein
MAATDIVNPSRKLILQGDVAYNRPVSEAILSTFASTNNFISKFQTDYHSFFLNGTYGITSGLFGLDGAYTGFSAFDIVGVTIWNAVAGVSGTTALDIFWINQAGVNQSSIFSTTPKISSAASNGTRGFRNLETGNDFTMPGVTLPVLSKTQFLEGETLYMKINSTMSQAQNCALTLNIRPRSI